MVITKKNMNQKPFINQQGNTFIGIVIGLILGLGIALGVAYVISKNSPEEKTNLRPPEISLSPKSSNLNDSGQIPDVNEPLRKNKSNDEVSNDRCSRRVSRLCRRLGRLGVRDRQA